MQPAWHDDDFQLALWACYELHYRGFDDVHENWQWHPAVIAFLGELERRWVASLRGSPSSHSDRWSFVMRHAVAAYGQNIS